MHKKGKLDDKTYKAVYPSGSTTPSASMAVKAHKPAKNYPVRVIVSHIGAPQEHLASHLNDLLKPLIVGSPLVCKNSAEFVEKIKNISLSPEEKMISFDAEALFPSVPILDCIDVIKGKLQNDPNLNKRTRLSPDEIADLLRLCLESTDFIFDGRHNTTNDSGPIGLSLMVTTSQIWMIYTMETAIRIAEEKNLALPHHLQIYMDDCWCAMEDKAPRRLGLRSGNNYKDPAETFNEILNSIHPRVKFTRETEIEGSIAFLDVLLTRDTNGKLSTKIYRKPTNTNVIIKPHSCHHPAIHTASFKGEICRATRICSSPTQVKQGKVGQRCGIDCLDFH